MVSGYDDNGAKVTGFYFIGDSDKMGGHGKGVFGYSSANVKGHKRVKCPYCGRTFVEHSMTGYANLHIVDNGKVVHCGLTCPRCHSKNWSNPSAGFLRCGDCGYSLI